MKGNLYFVHPTSVVDQGAVIGRDTKIWHFSHISAQAMIGQDCKIGQNVFISDHVKIGNNVKIQNNVSIYTGVVLEDDVFCGPSMVFTNIVNPRSKFPRSDPKYYQKTLVKQGASIGANATILCGITIGKHSFIGAASVVTKSVPDYGLVYGNPAILKGWVCVCGKKLEGKNQEWMCPDCQKAYDINGQKVTAKI